MLASYIEHVGPPEAIRYGKLADPIGGPTDAVVDLIATTVNPVDALIRSGRFATPMPFPFIVGRDAVGTVVSVGAGVTGFRVGDLVWTNSLGHGGRQGAAAERLVVPADRLYRLPEGVAPEVAVAVAHPAATAFLALFVHARIRPGDVVVVAGAAGNVGSALVVLGREAGARVVAIAAGRDAGYCRDLGADAVIDYADDVTAQLQRACPHGIDVYVDTSGHNDFESIMDLMVLRGRIIVLAGGAGRPVLPVGALYTRDRSIIGFVISHATTAELFEASRAVNRLLAAGRLRPRQIERLRLADLAEAHRRIEAGPMHGVRFVVAP